MYTESTRNILLLTPQLFCRNFEMRLIKRNNYPPYILDTVDRTVLEDDNGNPIMVSHFFDQQELGCRAEKWRKNDIHFGNVPLHACYLYECCTIEVMKQKYHL